MNFGPHFPDYLLKVGRRPARARCPGPALYRDNFNKIQHCMHCEYSMGSARRNHALQVPELEHLTGGKRCFFLCKEELASRENANAGSETVFAPPVVHPVQQCVHILSLLVSDGNGESRCVQAFSAKR